MPDIVITKSDHEKKILVHTGDRILIQLDENPTTGYLWKLCSTNYQFIELVDSNDFSSIGTGVGGGGTRLFIFMARLPGLEEIKFKLRRNWETEDMSIDHFNVIINITEY